MADSNNRNQSDSLIQGSNEVNRGIQAVADALVLEDFPMDRHEVDYAVGDIEIENGANAFIPVRELTDRMTQESFSSPEEIIVALRDLTAGAPMPQISRERMAREQDSLADTRDTGDLPEMAETGNIGGIGDVRDDASGLGDDGSARAISDTPRRGAA